MLYKEILPDQIDSVATATLERTIFNEEENGVAFYDSIIDRSIMIRLADSDSQRSRARVLLNRMYSWRGYGNDHTIAQLPSHTTFTASSNSEVFGTITLAVDSPGGLAADTLFKDIIDTFRARPGVKVCELTKFAFDTAKPSKPMLASLFHLIFIYGERECGGTDLFIEVNPRHVRFYRTMLGFTPLGEVKENTSVAAPAQLMWLSVATIRDQISLVAGCGDVPGYRSLYAYFFSAREEDGLYARMLSSRGAKSAQKTAIRRQPAFKNLLLSIKAGKVVYPFLSRRSSSATQIRSKSEPAFPALDWAITRAGKRRAAL